MASASSTVTTESVTTTCAPGFSSRAVSFSFSTFSWTTPGPTQGPLDSFPLPSSAPSTLTTKSATHSAPGGSPLSSLAFSLMMLTRTQSCRGDTRRLGSVGLVDDDDVSGAKVDAARVVGALMAHAVGVSNAHPQIWMAHGHGPGHFQHIYRAGQTYRIHQRRDACCRPLRSAFQDGLCVARLCPSPDSCKYGRVRLRLPGHRSTT